MIVHCMKKENWEKEKNDEFICYEELEGEGFLHNSRPEHLWRILPRFEDEKEDYVLLCIDEDKLVHEREMMDKEIKDVANKMAEYAGTEKSKQLSFSSSTSSGSTTCGL